MHAIVYKLLHARSRIIDNQRTYIIQLLIHRFIHRLYVQPPSQYCNDSLGIYIQVIFLMNKNSTLKLNRAVTFSRGLAIYSKICVSLRNFLSAHLNSYISERSHKANNLSGDHTLVKIIAKLWDAYSFNYQLALPGQ